MARIQLLSWTLLLAALLSCGALFYASSAISGAAIDSVSRAQTAQQALTQRSFQKRLSALALETQTERQTLETMSSADIVSIVTLLEQSDTTKKLGVKVNGAQAEGGAAAIPGGSLNALSFVIEASGGFQALMRQVSIFEHVPLPSQVEQVGLERPAGQGSGTWHLTVRLRVYTTAPVSSS